MRNWKKILNGKICHDNAEEDCTLLKIHMTCWHFGLIALRFLALVFFFFFRIFGRKESGRHDIEIKCGFLLFFSIFLVPKQRGRNSLKLRSWKKFLNDKFFTIEGDNTEEDCTLLKIHMAFWLFNLVSCSEIFCLFVCFFFV